MLQCNELHLIFHHFDVSWKMRNRKDTGRSILTTYGGGLTQSQVNDLCSLAGSAERDDLIAALDTLKPDPPTSQPTSDSILREFVADVQVVGIEAVRNDWPDLAATFQKALEILPPQTERCSS